MKLFTLLLLYAAPAFAEAPKVTVVHTTALACSITNSLIPGACRQSVVVIVEPKTLVAGDKFLVGIRYLAEDGTETLEVRYPVTANAAGITNVWFYLDNVQMLSATAASMINNQTGIWIQPSVTQAMPLQSGDNVSKSDGSARIPIP